MSKTSLLSCQRSFFIYLPYLSRLPGTSEPSLAATILPSSDLYPPMGKSLTSSGLRSSPEWVCHEALQALFAGEVTSSQSILYTTVRYKMQSITISRPEKQSCSHFPSEGTENFARLNDEHLGRSGREVNSDPRRHHPAQLAQNSRLYTSSRTPHITPSFPNIQVRGRRSAVTRGKRMPQNDSPKGQNS